MPVTLKTYKRAEDSFRNKQEYDLLQGEDIAGAGHVLELFYDDNKSYLVCEDVACTVLDQFLSQADLDTVQFLRLAGNAARALASIHEAGIIHCDINPANMLIHPQTLDILYINFGIAISTKRPGGKAFVGTLDYMAPEQTGRLNMVVDTRSDLYSLGIVLYYLLSRRMPFRGESAAEIIHAQTVLPPPPLSRFVAVDPMVEALVLKLLEKVPKKRYQSARSLADDLDRCLTSLEEKGSVEAFFLGERDVFVPLEPGGRLLGKARNFESLVTAYHETGANTGRLVLLHGPPGSGKTTLIDTFADFAVTSGAHLLRGSFNWWNTGDSYTALREMFTDFERYAYGENLPATEYRRRILEELGDNAVVLQEIIPGFTTLLGVAPGQGPIPLPLSAAAERARLVFSKTLQILCDVPGPCVLVFDNLQYADESSLDLLLAAIDNPELGNCLMLLSYQDNDPAFLAGMKSRLSGLSYGLGVTDIPVTFLHPDQIAALLVELFELEDAEAGDVAGALHDATGGEPERLRELLKQMYQRGFIQCDPVREKWRIDPSGAGADSPPSYEAGRLAEFRLLSEEDRLLLGKLACAGENFCASCMSAAFDIDPGELDGALARLQSLGWIKPAATEYAAEHDHWSFSEKVRLDLCYASLDPGQRDETHRLIVEKLYPLHRRDEQAFLSHAGMFLRQIAATGREGYGEQLLHDIGQNQLSVAMRCVQVANLQQAAREFESGIALLGAAPFDTDYSLAYAYFLNYALCCLALDDEERAARLFGLVLANATGEDDTYTAYYRIVDQYLSRAQWAQARAYARQYLGLHNLLLDKNTDPVSAGEIEFQRSISLYGDRDSAAIIDLPYTADSLLEHHCNLLTMLAMSQCTSLDQDTKYYLYRAVNMALERQVLYTKAIYAFPLTAIFHATVERYETAHAMVKTGLKLADKLGTGHALLWCVYGNMVSHWVNPISETLEIYKKAKYYARLEYSSFAEAFADMMLFNYQSFVGANLDTCHRDITRAIANLEHTGQQALRPNFITFRQYVRCLLGRTAGPGSFDDSQFTEAALSEPGGSGHDPFNAPFYYVYRLLASYIHCDFEAALDYAEKYRQTPQVPRVSAYLTHVQFNYFYSLSLLELCRLHPENRPDYLRRIADNQKELLHFATLSPENFACRHELVATSVRALEGQGIELIGEYSREHKVFIEKGFQWDLVFLERHLASFWIDRGIPQYMGTHDRNQLVRLKDMGARVCIRLLMEMIECNPVRKQAAEDMFTLVDPGLAAGGGGQEAGPPSRVQTGALAADSPAFSGAVRRPGINVVLDFEALLHALERLLAATSLSSLARELAELLCSSDNAEKVYVFLAEGQDIHLWAEACAVEDMAGFTADELPRDLAALEGFSVPKKLVREVVGRGDIASSGSAHDEAGRIGDDYFSIQRPESFLCLPITKGGTVLGAVYLENASLPGAFPDSRVDYLATLVQQSAALVQNLKNTEYLADHTKNLENRLSNYLAQQNALIAGIAHEINTPVGVCLTVSTKIRENTLEVTDAFNRKQLGVRALRKYLEETGAGMDLVSNNVRRTGDLVHNFKKISVDQSNEVFETIELAPVLRNIVEYVWPGVKKRINAIDIEAPDGLYIYSSSGVLAQIFTNLIMNSAIHAFEDRPKESNHAKIQVTDHEAEDEIEIRYSDNGVGMDAETREKVFDPFYTTRRNRGGSGLGGHIILTCVTQQLHGSILCESEVDQGTTFIIRLPKNPPDTQTKG